MTRLAILAATTRRRRPPHKPAQHPAEQFLGFVWRPIRAAGEHPPRFQKSITLLRNKADDEARFSKRIDLMAEQLRQLALQEVAGSHPRVVVHLSPSRTEAIIEVVVLWHSSSPTA